MTLSSEGMDEKPRPVAASMAPVRKVLVTGFEPFGGHDRNISQEVAQRFEAVNALTDPWTGEVFPLVCETAVLSVDAEGSMEVAQRLRKGDAWDAVLHLGLCERCDVPRLERLARDALDMRIPDNAGRQERGASLDGGGDRGCWVDPTIWPIESFSHPYELSTNAGAFLCNETYFRTLEALSATNSGLPLPSPCLFVHLPHHSTMAVEAAFAFSLQCLAYLVRPYPPNTVHVVAGHLSMSNGHHVVTQRPVGDGDAGRWEYPGGKCEQGEDWRQSLTRELDEELALSVQPRHLLGTWVRTINSTHYAVHLAHCDWSRVPEAIRLRAHAAFQLLDTEQTPALNWAGRDGEMFAHIRELSHNQVDASPSASIAKSSLMDRGT
jgi:pyroglutamyl-peptidase